MRPTVSVVVTAGNDAHTIADVIREAGMVHDLAEVIVVAGRTKDETAARAAAQGAEVVHCLQPYVHDFGRSVGAAAARGEILLFIGGDVPFPASALRLFVHAVRNGVDVALNRYDEPIHEWNGELDLSKRALNAILGRPDLRARTLSAYPHAMSRTAMNTIGPDVLTAPPKAHAAAIRRGLEVAASVYLPYAMPLPPLPDQREALERLRVGDHLEAIRGLLTASGPRAGRTDLGRHRWAVRE